jgi:type IV pilus assembly protein PilE
MKKRLHKGFTLIELLIVVAVISILAAIAFPSYKAYVVRAKRAAARTAIQNMAQQQERYFTQNNGYLSVVSGSGTIASGWVNYVGDTYATRFYDLTTTVTAATTTLAAAYTISAAPANGWTDATCGTLALTSAGLQSPTSPSDCWQR